MSFQDLSITGSPTPRANSRQAVSARRQKMVPRPLTPSQGGVSVTKEQIALARKLVYYEAEVENARKDQGERKIGQKKVHLQEQKTVPPLKLALLKRPGSSSSTYHVTRGVDTARSVLSWGEDSVRCNPDNHPSNRANHPGNRDNHPGKIDVKSLERKRETRLEKEEEAELIESARDSDTTYRDQDGDFEQDVGQLHGFEHYETEEESVKRRRKEKTVEEQMLQDLTQPETTDTTPYTLRTPWATTERADFYALKEMPRIRRMGEDSLHATSKELTFDKLNERGIEKRLSVRLRIVSRCGRDSLRDLYGFFFNDDNSLVIYEYKEIGKRCTTSPLFPRKCYYHPHGRWIGNPYSLRDLKIGATLYLPSAGNPVLSETLTRAPHVQLRVTSLDPERALQLVHDGCRIEEKAEREEQLKCYLSDEELYRIRNLRNIQDQIKRQIVARPMRSLVGLGHYFALHDKDKDGYWRSDEFQAVLRTFRIKLSYQEFVTFWNILDTDGSGLLDVGEFLRGLLGELSEARIGLVYKAWVRMDPTRAGEVSYETIRHFYNPAISLNPDTDCELTRDQLIEEFLECFSAGPLNQKITYCEFMDYYTALSLSEENDEVFVKFMKHCWNV